MGGLKGQPMAFGWPFGPQPLSGQLTKEGCRVFKGYVRIKSKVPVIYFTVVTSVVCNNNTNEHSI